MDHVLWDLALVLGRLGLLTFGGGPAVLGELEREVVGRGWMTRAQFVDAFALSQLAPGPGHGFMIPIGYEVAGLPGVLVALVAFFGPTVALMFGLMAVWGRVRESRWPRAIRTAMPPVAIGLVLASALALARTAVRDPLAALIVAGTVAVMLRTRISAPVAVLGAAVLGAVFLQP